MGSIRTVIYVGVTCIFVTIIVSGIGQIITKVSVQSTTTALQTALNILRFMHLSPLWPYSSSLDNATSFDFIIAGGGVAGSILAKRLTESGKYTVLLIEAGGDAEFDAAMPSSVPYILGSEGDWSSPTEETNNSKAYHYMDNNNYNPANKVLGGRETVFLHYHIRADPACYDSWAEALNDSSWSYNSTLPYFIKSEHVFDEDIFFSKYASYQRTDGPVGFSRFVYNKTMDYLNAFAELGNNILFDKNGRDSVGYIPPLFEIVNDTIQHPARIYLSTGQNRTNLYILKNSLATKILFNKNKTATGIEVLDLNDGTSILNAAKEVIVSTGALRTPQLLMLSGIGPKEHLELFGIDVVADLPVGQDYQDLFGVLIAHQMQATNASTKESTPNAASPIFIGFPALNKFQTSHPDYLTENFILPAGGSIGGAYCSFFLGFNKDFCQTFLNVQATNDLLMTLLIKLDPKSRGKILLQSTDPTDEPWIYGGFLNNPEDQADLVKYLQDYTSVVNTTFFKSVGAEFVKPNVTECADCDLYSNDYWNCYIPRMVISISKYMSSCSMGKVVDTELKVKNVSNLRVVDASVLPNATHGHPMATVVMIAEKAAAMILEDYS